ncbi:MAG: VanW family protein [Clostridia bacterium]|nr:VanW family protein [Clostridia bacterium]
MNFKHFFAIVASFFLSACNGGSTPSPSHSGDVNRLNNAEVELDNNSSLSDSTSLIEDNSTNDGMKYAVSGDDNEETKIISPPEPPERKMSIDDSFDENLISSFSTKVYTKTADRVKNLHIVCDKLSGTILNPGEEFSYNDTCGPYNKEQGFGKATVFVNGEEVQEYGGGVCQLSSTLYNALKDLNIEILERHNHSKEVYYVPKNEDATVSYGSLDFRFKNNESYPIEIEAYSNENEVTVSIYKI